MEAWEAETGESSDACRLGSLVYIAQEQKSKTPSLKQTEERKLIPKATF